MSRPPVSTSSVRWNLDSDSAKVAGPIRHMIERITGMATIIGTEIHEDNLHSAIMKRVCDAFVVLADITDDNLNTCIEAGMGLAAGANVELVSRGNLVGLLSCFGASKCRLTRTICRDLQYCTGSCAHIVAESLMRSFRTTVRRSAASVAIVLPHLQYNVLLEIRLLNLNFFLC